MRFIFYYLYALANAGFEENYWNQVFMNDLWAAVLDAHIEGKTGEQ